MSHIKNINYINIKKCILFLIIATIQVVLFNNACFAAVDEGNSPKEAVIEENTPVVADDSGIVINSDEVEYFKDDEQIVATGHVVIDIERDGTKIESDKVIYDRLEEKIISEGNVKITQKDSVIYGDYARFDLIRNTGLINSPDAYLKDIKIVSKKAKVYSDNIQAFNGKATLNKNDMVLILSAGAGAARGQEKNNFFQHRPGQKTRFKYDVDAKEIIVDNGKYGNIITLRNAKITINKFRIAKAPSIKIYTDKEIDRIEHTLPEFGHRHRLGSYVGYGHVFGLPKGATLKLLPIFSWGDGTKGSDIGIGGMARIMTSTNKTEVFYSSLRDQIVFEGTQQLPGKLKDTTLIQYGKNSYIDNGFFGRQMHSNIYEIVDSRNLINAYNMKFSIRTSAGIVEDEGHAMGRFQLQGALGNVKPIFSLGKYMALGVSSNFHVGAYGNGDSYGVLRIGPTLATSLGPLYLDAAYYQGKVLGKTPFLFDEYRYGESNVSLRGILDITKYFAVGYITSLNLTEDNWEEKLITENQVYLWVGPEDLKFRLGYDIEREQTVFGFNIMVGSDNSTVDFEKLKVIQDKKKK